MPSGIEQYLNQIRTATYGRQVRSAIADGIEACYNRDGEDSPLNIRKEVLAGEFNANIDYVTGQHVYYEGYIYHFTEDHPHGAWIGTDAEIISLAESIDDMQQEFGQSIYTMQQQINDLLYEEIAFTSYSINPSSAEKGSTVTSVTISWSLNKVPTSMTLGGSAVPSNKLLQSSSITQSGSWTTNTDFIMTATDDRSYTTPNRTATLTFMNQIYFGAAAYTDSPNSTLFSNLSTRFFNSKSQTFNINCGTNQHVYIAFPSTNLGTLSFKDLDTNLGFGFDSPMVVSITNASGYSEYYNVYRSTNSGLGSCRIGSSS